MRISRIATGVACALLGLCLDVPAVFAQSVPSLFVPSTLCRLYDSRTLPEGTPLSNGVTRQIAVRGECGIPEEANAIFATITTTGASSEGYVVAWASDLVLPTAASLTWKQTPATSGTFIRLCAPPVIECSEVDMSFRVEVTPAHVIIDVVGYTLPVEPAE